MILDSVNSYVQLKYALKTETKRWDDSYIYARDRPCIDMYFVMFIWAMKCGYVLKKSEDEKSLFVLR